MSEGCESSEQQFAARFFPEAGELFQVNQVAKALRVIARSEVKLSEHIALLTNIASNLTNIANKQRERDNSFDMTIDSAMPLDLLRNLQIRHVSLHSIVNSDMWLIDEVKNFEYVAKELLLALAAIEDPSVAQKRLAELSPSIFVAVFTARTSVVRRRLVRDMWARASKITGDRIMAKFVVCDGDDGRQHELLGEARAFEDLLFLDCQEGYNRTMLTKKLFVAMRAYTELFADKQLFMKVDDDTFVAWKRLIRVLARKSSPVAYMGIPSPEGKKVNREPGSIWYQPYETYPNKTYPMNMEGGPGYVLGRDLVRAMLDTGIAARNLGLSNEDQACGIWVRMLQHTGVHVNVVALTGTDGYKPEYDVCSGKWGDYPFLLHHKLEGEVISCLADVDAENDADMNIDDCFFICHLDRGSRMDRIESPYLVDHLTSIGDVKAR